MTKEKAGEVHLTNRDYNKKWNINLDRFKLENSINWKLSNSKKSK